MALRLNGRTERAPGLSGSEKQWGWNTLCWPQKIAQIVCHIAPRYAVCGPVLHLWVSVDSVGRYQPQSNTQSQALDQGDPVSKWLPILTLVWIPSQYHRHGGLNRGVVKDSHSTVAGEEAWGIVIHVLHMDRHICLAGLAASVCRLGNKAVHILPLSV